MDVGPEGEAQQASKVLQRHLFRLIADNEKLSHMLSTYWLLLPLPSQITALVKLWRYPCPIGSPNFFTASGEIEGICRIFFDSIGRIKLISLDPLQW